jgi:phenylacetate-CoA ligase
VLLCALGSRIEYSTRAPLLGNGALHRLSTLRPDALARLHRAAPAVVFSDPSGLHWLAEQPRPPQPGLILCSGQYLSASQRQALAGVTRAPVVNYYATTDTGPIAWECLERGGRFHVLLPEVWVESLEGELAVTRLRPSVLPLLRYRTGDAGTVEREECACGYRGWSILRFEGRRSCWYRLPDGTRVDAWRLAPVFKQHALAAFRLTQTQAAAFHLELTGSQPPELRPALSDALRALGWSAPRLTITPRARIATDGGKPQPFASSAA